MTSAITKRLQSLRPELAKKRIDCLIVTKPENVRYLTGFSGDDSWAIITPRGSYLLTDSRYTEQANSQCRGCKVIERRLPMAEAAAKLIGRRSGRLVAVEQSTSLGIARLLTRHLGAPVKPFSDELARLRSVKDPGEVAAIREAVRIAARALRQAQRSIGSGMTEAGLAALLDFHIRTLGATNGFDTIVAFGPNASRPHHQPGGRRLRKNDAILIDFGARCRGYCCDITRCFVLGRPTRLYERVYRVVEQAQAAAILAIRPGADIPDVDAAARRVIQQANLPAFGHGSGHGIGLEVHELPFLNERAKGRLQPGQVITIEPAVYMPGKLGVRIEDDILITESGCELLSRSCPHFMSLARAGTDKPNPRQL